MISGCVQPQREEEEGGWGVEGGGCFMSRFEMQKALLLFRFSLFVIGSEESI